MIKTREERESLMGIIEEGKEHDDQWEDVAYWQERGEERKKTREKENERIGE